jgi:hypothetical protein
MPNQLAEHLKCSKSRLSTFIKMAGVKRRVRYVSGENQPVYYPFTEREVEAILRAAWTCKGRAQARKMGIR